MVLVVASFETDVAETGQVLKKGVVNKDEHLSRRHRLTRMILQLQTDLKNTVWLRGKY